MNGGPGNTEMPPPFPFSLHSLEQNKSPTHGFQPRSAGLMYRMPALETVAGVAVLRWLISNTSRMVRFRGIRSLLARVRTWQGTQACGFQLQKHPCPEAVIGPISEERAGQRHPLHPCGPPTTSLTQHLSAILDVSTPSTPPTPGPWRAPRHVWTM